MADETRSGPEPDTRSDSGDCPNPLAANPMVAWNEADERLDNGWIQARCPDCGLWGWIAPDEEGKQ
ncbi:Protein of unknown function [Propionibacterium freudenreichii]|nr:Protein of unknown function [Propionibacterium freudenreichii]